MAEIDNIVQFILEEELAPKSMAKQFNVERTATFVGPESGRSNQQFFNELNKVKLLKGTKKFDAALNKLRKEFNPTLAGTNLGDNQRYQEFVDTFGKDRVADLILNDEQLPINAVVDLKREEVARSQAEAAELVGAESFANATPGMRLALTSLVNNAGKKRAANFTKALKAFQQGDVERFSAELRDSRRYKQFEGLRRRTEREIAEAQRQPVVSTIETPILQPILIEGPNTEQLVQQPAPVALPNPTEGITQDIAIPFTFQPPGGQQLNQELNLTDLPAAEIQVNLSDLPPAQPTVDLSDLPEAAAPSVPNISQQAQQTAFSQTPVIPTTPTADTGIAQQDIQNATKTVEQGLASGLTFGASRPLETAAEAGIRTLLPQEIVQQVENPYLKEALTKLTEDVSFLKNPLLFSMGLASAAAQKLLPSTRENIDNVFKEVGQETKSRRENLAALDLTAEIVGGIPTGRAMERLTRAGISVLATGNRVAKLTRAINKGKIALESGSLSLPRAKQVHAVTQAMIREKIAKEVIPRIIAEGATGAGFGAGVSAFEDISHGESVDLHRMKQRAALGGAGGALFGAATSGLGAVASKLSRAPKKVGAMRFAEEQQMLEEITKDTYDEVQKLVNQGSVRQADMGPLIYAKTLGRLQEAGVHLDHNFDFGIGSKFLRNVEKFNLADKALKTNTTEIIMDLIRGTNIKAKIKADAGNKAFQITKNLQATGLSPQQITRALRYVEVDELGQPFFNASARGGRNIRAAWENSSLGRELGALTEDQVEGLFELRRWFANDIEGNFPQFAEMLGQRKVQGYVPLYARENYRRAPKIGGNFEGILDPKVAKQRAANTGFDSRIHEEDINKIIDIYTSQLAKHEAFAPIIPRLARENFKLQMIGRDDIAANLIETAARTMNVGMKKELTKELGKHFASDVFYANRDMIEQLTQRVAPSDPTFLSKVLDTLHSATYANLLFTNIRTLAKQAVQVPLVGAGEVTIPAMVRGQKSWTMNDKVGKLAKEMMPLMRAQDPSVLREAILRPDQGFRNIKKLMTIAGKPGEYVFNKLDVRNRGTAFAAAYHQFENALKAGAGLEGRSGQAVLEDLFDGMLSGEKSLVINQWRQHGEEAAKRMYSIIRSRRINFAYGIADTPEFFAEGVGRLIPFTTWSGNMLARVVGDVSEKNYGALAKRVALPLAYMSAFRVATGYDLPGAHPLSAVPGAFGLQVVPSVAGPAIETAKGGPLAGAQEALKFTPVGPLSRIANQVRGAVSSRKSERARSRARLLGLDVDEERDPFKRALPKFLREAVTTPERALPFDTRRLLNDMLR